MQYASSRQKTLMLGGIGGRRSRDDKGCDCWMASPTRWTWVWVNSRSWWWTERPGILRFMGWQRVGHDWATELNWTNKDCEPKNIYIFAWLAKVKMKHFGLLETLWIQCLLQEAFELFPARIRPFLFMLPCPHLYFISFLFPPLDSDCFVAVTFSASPASS